MLCCSRVVRYFDVLSGSALATAGAAQSSAGKTTRDVSTDLLRLIVGAIPVLSGTGLNGGLTLADRSSPQRAVIDERVGDQADAEDQEQQPHRKWTVAGEGTDQGALDTCGSHGSSHRETQDQQRW